MNFLQDLSEWNAAGMKTIINKYTVYIFKLWKLYKDRYLQFPGCDGKRAAIYGIAYKTGTQCRLRVMDF